jgi:hypothetical protein
MIKVCPHPSEWHSIHTRLEEFSRTNLCAPPRPPAPLILNGWVYSNDRQKLERWAETVSWCAKNDCFAILETLSDRDFYCVKQLTEHQIGPVYGPMYTSWNREPRQRPDLQQIATCMASLDRLWPDIAGAEVAGVTRPVRLTGAKARRLVVMAAPGHAPPWGDWDRLSSDPLKRRAFTCLRAAVNQAIAPHEIDHIDFAVGRADRSDS